MQYACVGQDVLISCPDENVNNWQKVETADILAICEHGMVKINESLPGKISISGACHKLSIMNFTKDDAGKYACFTIRKEKVNFKKYLLEVKLRSKYSIFNTTRLK